MFIICKYYAFISHRRYNIFGDIILNEDCRTKGYFALTKAMSKNVRDIARVFSSGTVTPTVNANISVALSL
jgi:hypothetical protein